MREVSVITKCKGPYSADVGDTIQNRNSGCGMRDASCNSIFLFFLMVSRVSLCLHRCNKVCEGVDFLHGHTPPVVHRDLKS